MAVLRRGKVFLINGHPYVFMGTLRHYKLFYGGKKGMLKVLLESDTIVEYKVNSKGAN